MPEKANQEKHLVEAGNQQPEQPTTALAILGETAQGIVRLSEEAVIEIKSKWNEKTMTVIRDNSEVYLQKATGVQIKTDEDLQAATELFLDGADYLKRGTDFINPFVDATHKPWKTMTDIRKEFKDKIEAGRKMLNDKISAWKMAEKRRIEAEQRKLDAERAAKERADREKLLKQAEKAEAAGKVEKAEAKRAEAETVYTPPTVLADPVRKTTVTGKGTVSGRKTYKVDINDEMEMVCGVARRKIFESAPLNDPQALKMWVLEQKAREGLPISCLNLDLKKCDAAIKRWADVQKITDYNDNGIHVQEWENQAANVSRGKQQ